MSKNPHLELAPLYKRILRVLEKFPKDYAYRKETEKLAKERLQIVKEVKLILLDIIAIILHIYCS